MIDGETVGMIAGGGQFPLLIAEAARKQGVRIVAVAHHDETEPSLSEKVDEIVGWAKDATSALRKAKALDFFNKLDDVSGKFGQVVG